MTYLPEIWKQMSDRYVALFMEQIGGAARTFGFKFKRGEVKYPEALVKELIADAYKQGARAALEMAAEVDG